jgi:hypothetical protein
MCKLSIFNSHVSGTIDLQPMLPEKRFRTKYVTWRDISRVLQLTVVKMEMKMNGRVKAEQSHGDNDRLGHG